MAQFDVHRNTAVTKAGFPYLAVLQSSLFKSGERRVVIPLIPAERLPQHDPRLNPVFEIEGSPHMLATQGITNIPRERLGAVVGNLRDDGERIIAAVDWLMNRRWD